MPRQCTSTIQDSGPSPSHSPERKSMSSCRQCGTCPPTSVPNRIERDKCNATAAWQPGQTNGKQNEHICVPPAACLPSRATIPDRCWWFAGAVRGHPSSLGSMFDGRRGAWRERVTVPPGVDDPGTVDHCSCWICLDCCCPNYWIDDLDWTAAVACVHSQFHDRFLAQIGPVLVPINLSTHANTMRIYSKKREKRSRNTGSQSTKQSRMQHSGTMLPFPCGTH